MRRARLVCTLLPTGRPEEAAVAAEPILDPRLLSLASHQTDAMAQDDLDLELD